MSRSRLRFRLVLCVAAALVCAIPFFSCKVDHVVEICVVIEGRVLDPDLVPLGGASVIVSSRSWDVEDAQRRHELLRVVREVGTAGPSAAPVGCMTRSDGTFRLLYRAQGSYMVNELLLKLRLQSEEPSFLPPEGIVFLHPEFATHVARLMEPIAEEEPEEGCLSSDRSYAIPLGDVVMRPRP